MVENVVSMLGFISDERNMRVPVQRSKKTAGLAVTGALLGVLLGGAPGMAVGSALGGLVGAGISKPCKPVSEIIQQLSHNQKQKLLDKVKAVICNVDRMDKADLMVLVMRSERLQQQLADVLVGFIETELKTKVQSGF
ncbi:protein C19orf12-like [Phyllostomus hastatus]|uniref:protein C19orf12-like n=1 Tax=Phyllostomus hastatus TaxID=9423 RepID=UPI001E6808A3|nr:protein C19orf12-like [Phyllostomus hastatus]